MKKGEGIHQQLRCVTISLAIEKRREGRAMSELVLQVSRTAETVTPRVPSETRANKMMFGGGGSRNRLGLPETSPSEGTLLMSSYIGGKG